MIIMLVSCKNASMTRLSVLLSSLISIVNPKLYYLFAFKTMWNVIKHENQIRVTFDLLSAYNFSVFLQKRSQDFEEDLASVFDIFPDLSSVGDSNA